MLRKPLSNISIKHVGSVDATIDLAVKAEFHRGYPGDTENPPEPSGYTVDDYGVIVGGKFISLRDHIDINESALEDMINE